MSYCERKLVRQQLDTKLLQFKCLAAIKADSGWIKLIRESLDMTTTLLSKQVGIDQSRIFRMENTEADGYLKLSSLKKIAIKRMKKVSHTMWLQNQELSKAEKAKAMEDLVQKILIEEPKDFWDQ